MNRQKELQIIEDRQLTSVMNETRWKRLGHTVSTTLPYLPPYQLKYLGEDTLFPSDELSQFENLDWDDVWVESSLRSIEWLRLRTKVLLYKGVLIDPDVYDMTDELIDILKKERIPFIQNGDIIQVYGYVRDTGIFER